MSIMFMGDVHGEKRFLTPFLESDSKILIQLGDFGFVWKYNDCKYNRFIHNFSKNYPDKKIIFVPGNHENYSALLKQPMVKIFGARARKVSPNIFALERGEIVELENKKFLALGGAYSIDKDWREPLRSWWPEEEMTAKEMLTFLEKSDKIIKENQIDYIISHTMPLEIVANQCQLYSDNSLRMEKFFNELLEKYSSMNFKWYGGHWHISYEAIYNNVFCKIFNIGEFLEE